MDAAAAEMAKVPTKSPDKTSKACSAKYGWVSSFFKNIIKFIIMRLLIIG